MKQVSFLKVFNRREHREHRESQNLQRHAIVFLDSSMILSVFSVLSVVQELH